MCGSLRRAIHVDTIYILLVVLIFGCGCEPAVDSGGSLVSKEGRIAFTRATSFEGPDFEADIYTIDVAGSREIRLTDSPGLDGFPAWSPDGQKIAFTSERDGNWEIYVMDADGADPKRLTNTPHDESSAAFSPDGEKIAYVVGSLSNPEIRVMNANGTGQKKLVGGNWPTWAPDGKRLSYTTYSDGERIFVADADGDRPRQLTDGGSDSEGTWSPDGRKIAFASGRDEDEEIYAMNPDGSGQTRLTDIPGPDHWPPTWSPSSDRIAFTSDGEEDNPEIYAMNADGSGLTKLTENPEADVFPAWRP